MAPKREKLKQATQAVEKKQKQLKQAQAQLAEVLAKVQALKDTYDESTSQKEKLQTESDELEAKLIRAEKLVNGLAGERTRWEQSIVLFEEELGYLPGDVVVAAAFLSYAGPFPSEYRNELVGQMYPLRTGSRERPSFMVMVELRSGNVDPEHWILRGTALLLALAI